MPGTVTVARALALANQLADAARSIARGYFRSPIAVEQKADRSPVTVADRAIETEMRRMIRAEFPTHGIQGEEFAAEAGAEFTWVLDPIDGTKSFISGFPLFGSLIALTQGARAVLGIIEAPAMSERWVGVEGRADDSATARRPTSVAARRSSTRASTAPPLMPSTRSGCGATTPTRVVRAFVAYGGDCYLYGLLAAGHCDLVIEAAMKPHDFQALVPVVEGAGGRISDWSGRPLDAQSGDSVLAAATQALWTQAVEALAGG